LDKIIERSTLPSAGANNTSSMESPRFEKGYSKDSYYSEQDRHRRPYKKKDSFFGDLFDF
jgi:Zn-finger nucleic acid-binding protein